MADCDSASRRDRTSTIADSRAPPAPYTARSVFLRVESHTWEVGPLRRRRQRPEHLSVAGPLWLLSVAGHPGALCGLAHGRIRVGLDQSGCIRETVELIGQL